MKKIITYQISANDLFHKIQLFALTLSLLLVTINGFAQVPTIIVTASPDAICQGAGSTLAASGATSYIWSPAESLNSNTGASVIATPTETTIYTVTMTNPDVWMQKADFSGTSRFAAVSFSIGTKAYIGTGSDNAAFKRDFWEYDPLSNSWTQKADFGGTARFYAVGFSIGTKGYIGTGYDNNIKKDFWEYDPLNNSWIQKADFGGTARLNAVGFSIGTKGYIGTGRGGGYKNDFWEYDQNNDTWVQKANFGGSARDQAVGFSIGTKGYIGTGIDNVVGYARDFWEYDQNNNTWTRKADFGGGPRYLAVGFSIGLKGYIGTGDDINVGFKKDFWEYNPINNNWTQKADFGGTERIGSVGFSIGTKGYIGTGRYDNIWYNDFWEYNPESSSFATVTVQVNPLPVGNAGSPSTICSGNNVILGTTAVEGNTYSWVSSPAGFTSTSANPTVSPTVTTTYTLTEMVTATGCTKSNDVVITVNPLPTANAGPNKTVYYGYPPSQCATLNGSTSGGLSPYQYLWNTGAITPNITVCPTVTTTYTLTVTDANGCSKTDDVTVNVIDIRCGKNKVKVCHAKKTVCIAIADVQFHLAHGDYLGVCNNSNSIVLNTDFYEENSRNVFALYPNPTRGSFTVEVCKNNVVKGAKLQVVNTLGQIIYSKKAFKIEGCIKETIELSHALPEGMYSLNLIIGENVETQKIILIK